MYSALDSPTDLRAFSSSQTERMISRAAAVRKHMLLKTGVWVFSPRSSYDSFNF